MTPEQKLPGPDHPITVTPTGEAVTVRVADRIIAKTSNAFTLQESTYPAVQYIPLTDVDADAITRTGTHTYCPYKGEASYYSITTDAGELTDAIWTYEQPYDAVAEIAGYVAFYPNKVEISLG